MATNAQMHRLIGRALMEPEFRYILADDPKRAARMMRIKLSDLQLSKVEQLDRERMDELARQFEDLIGGLPGNALIFW